MNSILAGILGRESPPESSPFFFARSHAHVAMAGRRPGVPRL